MGEAQSPADICICIDPSYNTDTELPAVCDTQSDTSVRKIGHQFDEFIVTHAGSE